MYSLSFSVQKSHSVISNASTLTAPISIHPPPVNFVISPTHTVHTSPQKSSLHHLPSVNRLAISPSLPSVRGRIYTAWSYARCRRCGFCEWRGTRDLRLVGFGDDGGQGHGKLWGRRTSWWRGWCWRRGWRWGGDVEFGGCGLNVCLVCCFVEVVRRDTLAFHRKMTSLCFCMRLSPKWYVDAWRGEENYCIINSFVQARASVQSLYLKAVTVPRRCR